MVGRRGTARALSTSSAKGPQQPRFCLIFTSDLQMDGRQAPGVSTTSLPFPSPARGSCHRASNWPLSACCRPFWATQGERSWVHDFIHSPGPALLP